jgi:hypothetical protein
VLRFVSASLYALNKLVISRVKKYNNHSCLNWVIFSLIQSSVVYRGSHAVQTEIWEDVKLVAKIGLRDLKHAYYIAFILAV